MLFCAFFWAYCRNNRIHIIQKKVKQKCSFSITSVKLASPELLKKLRWSHLGYQFDYNNVEYKSNVYYGFPRDLASLASHIAGVLGYPDYNSESGVVNYYPLGSSMGGHVDKYENDLSQPLVSLSFGQSAVYLIGGKTCDVRPTGRFSIKMKHFNFHLAYTVHSITN